MTGNEDKLDSVTKGDAYFKALADTIPHIFFIIDPATYQITYINRLQPGFTKDQVIGTSMFNFVWPEYVHLYKTKIAEVLETRKPTVIEIVGASSEHSEGKGWYRTHIAVVPDESGDINGLMFISEDITQMKVRELEIINKGEKLKAIINNTEDVICSIDRLFRLSEFNEILAKNVRTSFGIELKQGMNILDFIEKNHHEHLIRIYNRVLNGETVLDVASFETSSGQIVYYESSFHPIASAENVVAGISIFSKNITERIHNEQKLRMALKEKEILLAEIHHRIKNNLAIVSSLLQLQEMNITNEEAKNALVLSRKRIKSTALIHELLYKSESFHNIKLNDYIKELFDLLRLNENIQLNLDGSEVKLDITKAMPLGMMLNEIMMNSFKHSYKNVSQGSTIIRTKTEGNELIIDYCDCNGSFPVEINFIEPTTTGLTLIHTFAQQLDGKIELTERKPPRYIISIPIHESH